MCGIVGYVGPQQAAPILIEGLRRMEYRGYDSAGIAVINGDRGRSRKAAGKLGALVDKLHGSTPRTGTVGVGPHPVGHPWRPHHAQRPSRIPTRPAGSR